MAKSNGKAKKEKEEEKESWARIVLVTKKSILGNIIDVVGSLVDDFKMTFSKKGMTILVVDPAHVAMLSIEAPKEFFDTYTFKSDGEEYEIGMEAQKLKDFMKSLSASDEITFACDSEEKSIVLRSGKLTRKMSMIDTTGMSNAKIPDLEMKSTIEMTNDILRTAITAVSQVSDHIAIKADAKKMMVLLSGEGDTDKVDMELDKNDKIEVKGEDSRSLYPLDYMESISKSIGTKNNIVFHFGTDYPCMIEFLIENDKTEAECVYLLAPRIESD